MEYMEESSEPEWLHIILLIWTLVISESEVKTSRYCCVYSKNTLGSGIVQRLRTEGLQTQRRQSPRMTYLLEDSLTQSKGTRLVGDGVIKFHKMLSVLLFSFVSALLLDIKCKFSRSFRTVTVAANRGLAWGVVLLHPGRSARQAVSEHPRGHKANGTYWPRDPHVLTTSELENLPNWILFFPWQKFLKGGFDDHI